MSDNRKIGPMNRAKNKPSMTEAEKLNSAVSSLDERTTVIVDEDLEGVEFEDRVWLYWRRNKNYIIFGILAAFVIALGVQLWKMSVAASERSLADAFEKASTPEELAAFAAANSGTALAGVALLENADSAYEAGDFAKAAELYNSAKADLSGSILVGRAKLGAAVSVYAGGDAEGGIAALRGVYNDAAISDAYKAQAGYILGLALKQGGKSDEAKTVFEAVASNPKAGVFASAAQDALTNMD